MQAFWGIIFTVTCGWNQAPELFRIGHDIDRLERQHWPWYRQTQEPPTRKSHTYGFSLRVCSLTIVWTQRIKDNIYKGKGADCRRPRGIGMEMKGKQFLSIKTLRVHGSFCDDFKADTSKVDSYWLLRSCLCQKWSFDYGRIMLWYYYIE